MFFWGFSIWLYFQQKSAASIDSTLNKFKYLGIEGESPINPPNFTLADQNGKAVSLSDFKNNNKVSGVKAFLDQEGLSKLKNWYFLTGPTDIKEIWKAYGITVIPSKTGTLCTPRCFFLLFVNSSGKEMYDGSPADDASTIKEWSNAISYIVKSMP